MDVLNVLHTDYLPECESPSALLSFFTPLLIHCGANALEKSHYISLCCCCRREPLLFPDSIKESSGAGLRLGPRFLSPLAGNCLILQQAGGETAATPMHVSLSGVGLGFGVTHKCCLGSSIEALPRGEEVRWCHKHRS